MKNRCLHLESELVKYKLSNTINNNNKESTHKINSEKELTFCVSSLRDKSFCNRVYPAQISYTNPPEALHYTICTMPQEKLIWR